MAVADGVAHTVNVAGACNTARCGLRREGLRVMDEMTNLTDRPKEEGYFSLGDIDC